jgi:hypothetical protein
MMDRFETLTQVVQNLANKVSELAENQESNANKRSRSPDKTPKQTNNVLTNKGSSSPPAKLPRPAAPTPPSTPPPNGHPRTGSREAKLMPTKQNQSLVKDNKTKNKLNESDRKFETEAHGTNEKLFNERKLELDNNSTHKKEFKRNKPQLIASDKTDISESDTPLEYSSSEESIKVDHIRDSLTERSGQKRNRTRLSSAWKQIFARAKIDKSKNTESNAATHTNLQQAHLTNSNRQELHTVFGNDIETHCNYECFLFHNINGIKDESNWSQILSAMKDLDITCFGFAELNTTMKCTNFRQWQDIIRKLFNTSKTSTSESDIKMESNYKPGGTMTTIVGNGHARVTEKGSDSTGLGRWSYLTINSNKKKLVVITAYKPCKAKGPNTNWTQQWLLLRETKRDPDPIQEFYNDLDSELRKWRKSKHEIILIMDANEEIGK